MRKIIILSVAVIFLVNLGGNIIAQEGPLISMDFQEAALKDVLKVFSQQAGLNFVATTTIESKQITLYLDGVTVQDALNSIMEANNLTYDQAEGSNVFVVKESGRAKINLITKVYTLGFARLSETSNEGSGTTQVSDIKSILENLLSKGEDGGTLGSIVVDKRTNSIIVTSIPDDFVAIEETIKKLDAITPQALIEAEIVEIQTSSLKRLGLEWGGTDGTFVRFSGPTRITHFPFIRNKNPFGRSLIGDVASTSTESESSGGTTETTTEAAQSSTLGTLSLSEFSIVLKALETMGEARYLAKPRIMALNNETAEINITADTTIGVTKTSVTDTGEVIEEAERTETGVSLKVTPTINSQGYITMTLEPSVSRAVQSPLFTNFADPAKRSAKTTIMVRDGQTIAIGGLLKTDEEEDNRATPGLSRIPFFGKLFKRDKVAKVETELIIFITAHAIMDVEELTTAKKEIEEIKEPLPIEAREKQMADTREAEIKKTVMKLRKKRDLERRTN
ncbi:MAG: hypothetical protein HQ572_05555 [Candidatus Omnitrophica bacterium]|nr:hypothetical protein [Candidatus Omnitrophota bacterium]